MNKPAPVLISCVVSVIGVIAALFVFKYLSLYIEPKVSGVVSILSSSIIGFGLYRFVAKVFGVGK